jgi:hypothetical protein
MAKFGVYYAGRVLKLGELNQDMLMEAIRNPATVKTFGNSWTFIDINEHIDESGRYILALFAKPVGFSILKSRRLTGSDHGREIIPWVAVPAWRVVGWAT